MPPNLALTFSAALLWGGIVSSPAACDTCANYSPGTLWGNATVPALTEASGIALSARTAGVLWTHNDGSRQKVFALGTNGLLLAAFDLNQTVQDLEDIAIGPGPVPGVSYLYVGDIGGDTDTGSTRSQVQILRMPEPLVEWEWASAPKSGHFHSLETFTLRYPDGPYDAEALMVDPVSGDVLVVTKQSTQARVYRANLNGATNPPSLLLQFVGAVPFASVSAGDISPDGKQIALRREEVAWLWARCNNEPIANALLRAGHSLPVIGPPQEPNGEAIAFLRHDLGYLTVSEGQQPGLYYFRSLCPEAPRFTQQLTNQSAFIGGSVQLGGWALGYPPPVYRWRFKGEMLSGESSSSLSLSQLSPAQAGQYDLLASNLYGVATSSAVLTIRSKPDLRITEVQSSTAPSPNLPTADWWELTSFEGQPVALEGWRFNDNTGDWADAFVLSSGLVIAPGESIVLVEGLTAAQFRHWWGSSNLPPALQIVTYTGSGLSFGASGDGVRLWSQFPSNPTDLVARADFGAAASGVTFNYNPVSGAFGQPSSLGVNGVFRAAASTDIGSPGRILAPATGPQLRAVLAGDRLRIDFTAAVGRRYHLETRPDWTTSTWMPTGEVLLATNNTPACFEQSRSANSFYRLRVE